MDQLGPHHNLARWLWHGYHETEGTFCDRADAGRQRLTEQEHENPAIELATAPTVTWQVQQGSNFRLENGADAHIEAAVFLITSDLLFHWNALSKLFMANLRVEFGVDEESC